MLGSALGAYAGQTDLLVLALPRGGVPVGYEVARSLGAPLDILVVRKLGVPGNGELAMGAVAPGGVCILREEIIAELGIPADRLAAMAAQAEEARRESEAVYRHNLPAQAIAGTTVVLVDDGVATGATMRAALAALRRLQARKIVIAAPVVSASTRRELEALADQMVCLAVPEILFTVGQWYVNFEQVSDEKVAALLEQLSTTFNKDPLTKEPPCRCRD
jgi:putative phosphoribosyl transferase